MAPSFRPSAPERLRTRSLPSKQTPKPLKCFYHFTLGYCLFGSLCRFSHGGRKYVEKVAPITPPVSTSSPSLSDPIKAKQEKFRAVLRKAELEDTFRGIREKLMELEREGIVATKGFEVHEELPPG